MGTGLLLQNTTVYHSISQYTTVSTVYHNILQYITVYHSILAIVHYSLILLSLYPFSTAAHSEPTASIPTPHKIIGHAIVHLIPPNSREDQEHGIG